MEWARTAVKSTLLVNQLCSHEPISSFGMGAARRSAVSRPARSFPWLSGSVGGQGRAHTSTQNPHVTLAMTPVIALARSDAIMTAASATSDSIGRRRSKVPLLASAKNSSGEIPAARA